MHVNGSTFLHQPWLNEKWHLVGREWLYRTTFRKLNGNFIGLGKRTFVFWEFSCTLKQIFLDIPLLTIL